MKKSLRRIGRVLFVVGVLLAIVVSLAIACSPYGKQENFDYKLISTSVVIDAPVYSVFNYLGNSDNAEDWSVYVDHIETLNGADVSDGKVGSVRRCYANADEKGKMWDEEVLAVALYKRRQLNCYNFKDFEVNAGTLRTEQIYTETADNKCLLTFTLFFPPGETTFGNELKMYLGSYTVLDIFERNLKNIKRFIEQQTP